MLTHDGQTLPLAVWAKRFKLPPNTIRARIDQLGWSVETALNAPADKRFRGQKKRPLNVPKPCPPLTRHSSGQAVCRWWGQGKARFRYFGKYASPEAATAYKRFQARWAMDGDATSTPGECLFVAEVAVRFLAHVARFYVKDGKPTSEQQNFRTVVRLLNELYGERPAGDFKPDHLREFTAALVGLGRRTVNVYAWRVQKLFKWAAGRSLVPPAVPLALKYVEKEQAGRSLAPDRPTVTAASVTDVEATYPHLHPRADALAVLEAMLRVQLLTGMRPGELCRLSPGQLDRTADVWVYAPVGHKNQHRGQRRVVYLGPQAQAVMAPLVAGLPAGEAVFAYPRKRGGPRTPLTVDLLAKRVAVACERAGVGHWHPHQLRHTRATAVQRRYESDVAVAGTLGDSPEVARQVYTDDPGAAVGRRIAPELG